MPLASPGVSGPYHYSDRMDHEETNDPGKVWSLSCLSLLDKIGVPVWLAASSFTEDRLSPGGFRNVSKPVYQNGACIRSFGRFRPQKEINLRLNNLPIPEKENRRELCKQLQTGDVHRSWVHAESLLSPVFNGLPADQKHMTLLQQVIQVETAPGHVESCQLNQVEQVASVESARLAAMHHCGPIHTFMFNKDGELLMANKRGLDRYRDIRLGGQVMLLDLFQQGVYTDLDTTPEEAYEEAMMKIFDHRAEVHRFSMPNMSRKQPSKARWTLFEMWPINDPVDGAPAVLVKLYNVTQQKHMEAELQTQKEALARQLAQLEAQKAQLEQYNATIQTEKDNLQLQNNSLAERLEAVVKEKLPSHQFDQETPVDKTLNLLQMLIMGEVPSNDETVALFHLLSQANVDLRQPVSLEEQLMEDSDMEAEVGLAMVQLLKGNSAGRNPSLSTAPAPPSSGSTSLDTPASPILEMSRSRARRSSMVSSSSITSENSLERELDFGLTASITFQVERMLQDAERNWQFDMFAFAEETNNNHLSVLTFHFMKISGLVSRFNLSEVKLSRFLCRIERGYLNNPYHSSLHVASVVHMIHMIMHHGGLLRKKVVDDLMMMAAYIAAAIHDFEHGGVNNDFLIQTRDKLAVTYNDISPLENHHLAAAARLMCEPRYRFHEATSRADQRTLRSAVIEQVLGTDMKKHFNILSRFQNNFQRRNTSTTSRSSSRELKENTFQRRDTINASRSSSMELPEGVQFNAPPRQSTEISRHRGSIDIRRHNLDSRQSMDLGARPAAEQKAALPARGSSSQNDYWENVSEENKAIIRQVMLKCADIGHLAAAPHVHRRWALLLEEEFFLQGDKEKALGMTVSPLMDRKNKGGITRSQMSFFSIVGIPLFKSMTDIFEDTRPMLQGVMENYKMWEREAASATSTSPRPHS